MTKYNQINLNLLSNIPVHHWSWHSRAIHPGSYEVWSFVLKQGKVNLVYWVWCRIVHHYHWQYHFLATERMQVLSWHRLIIHTSVSNKSLFTWFNGYWWTPKQMVSYLHFKYNMQYVYLLSEYTLASHLHYNLTINTKLKKTFTEIKNILWTFAVFNIFHSLEMS